MGRCKGNRIYTAKNIITGEEFSGSSRKIFERLNIPANSLYTYADRKSVYKKTWIFSFVDENVKESDEIPWEKWDEWDRERIRVKKWLKNKGKSKRKIEKTAVSEVT